MAVENLSDWYQLSASCPQSNTSLGGGGWLHTPTTSISHLSIAVVAFVAAVIVVTLCSSISALWRRSYPLAITNLHWILFFVLSSIQSALHCAVYILHFNNPSALHINFIAGTMLRSMQIFLVALAFQHERVYRRLAVAKENLSFHQSTCFEKCHSVNFLSTILLLMQGVLVALVETKFEYVGVVWASQGVLLAQRLVVLGLVGVILLRRNEEDAPSARAQVIVVLAMLLTTPADVTVHTLGSYQVFGQCFLYFGTLYDLFLMCHFVGLILLLVYIRLEYVRLLPVCQYSLISSIQSRYDFHPH